MIQERKQSTLFEDINGFDSNICKYDTNVILLMDQ